MGKKQTKVESFLTESGAILEGEQFVTAAKAMPLGGFKGLSRSSGYYMFGVVGAVAAQVAESRRPEPAEIEAKLKKGAYLALTSSRLFVMSIAGLSSNPNEIVIVVDRSAIEGVEMGTTRVSMVKLPTITLSFGPEDSLTFEFAKPDAKDAEALYNALL